MANLIGLLILLAGLTIFAWIIWFARRQSDSLTFSEKRVRKPASQRKIDRFLKPK